MIENVEYRGWANNVRVSNGEAGFIATLDVGPRVISYSASGGFNVMKNYDSMMGGTGEAEWQIRGGSRFWLAPEDLTRTYYPDNQPVKLEKLSDLAVRLTPPPETQYGVQKVMELELDAKGSGVRISLTVTNIGSAPTTLAPWSPTVMAPGGVEVIPLPSKRPHPGHPSNAKSPADYAPDQAFILWPYFDFADPRWTFGSRYALLRQDATMGPTKIGFGHQPDWIAYVNQGTAFVKRPPMVEGATYPDMGTIYQTFSNEDMLEMETVGVLTTIKPGESANLTEHWELFTGVGDVRTEVDAQNVLRPLLG